MIIDNRAFTLSKLYAAARVYLLRRHINKHSHCVGCIESQPNQLAHMDGGCLDDWTGKVSLRYEKANTETIFDDIKILVETLLETLCLPIPDAEPEFYCDDTVWSFLMLTGILWPKLDNLMCKVYEENILKLPSALCTFSDV